jgi:hypothetical protein
MLRLGGMAAAGAAGAAVLSAAGASPADATTGNMQYGAYNNAGSDQTSLEATNTTDTLWVGQNNPDGSAIQAVTAFGGPADAGFAVQATHVGSGTAVWAVSQAGVGLTAQSAGGAGKNAIQARQLNFPASGDAVVVTNRGSGTGIDISDFDTSIDGSATGTGSGIRTHLENASNASDAVIVTTAGSGRGIVVGTQSGLGLQVDTNTGNGAQISALAGTAILAAATNGSALSATAGLFNTNSVADAVHVTHLGKGRGLKVDLSNTTNAADAITVSQTGTGKGVNVATGAGTALNALAGTGIGLLATANTATSLNAAIKAQSNGKGQAVLAANTAAATLPAVQATSAAAVPAVQATGKAVPTSGSVPVAGNAAALKVVGVASFTRSGVATFTTAGTSILVDVPGGLSATSNVLATLQTNTGTVAVRAAVPNTVTGKITIYLTASVAVGTKVAWFVFG